MQRATAKPAPGSCGWSTPPASTVLIYRPGSFGEPTEGGPGEQLTSPLWPGFTPIDELFAR